MEEEDVLGDLHVDDLIKNSNEDTNFLRYTQTFRNNPLALDTMTEVDTDNYQNESLDNIDSNDDAFDDQIDTGKKRKKSRKDKIPEEIHALIGEANKEFALRNIHKSIDICKEIIRQAPRIRDPWTILGTIFEEAGSPDKALDFLIISAVLSKNELDKNESWFRLADMAKSLEKWESAVYCYNKLMRVNRDNTEEYFDALFHRSIIYQNNLKNVKKAVEGFVQIFDKYPTDAAVTKILSDIYWETQQIDELVSLLEKHIKNSDPPDLASVNHLAQCYIQIGEYNKMISTIKDKTVGVENVPVEILVKYAIGNIVLNKMEKADEVLDKMPPITSEVLVEYHDDYLALVETYINSGEPERALLILEKFDPQDAEVLSKLGACYFQMGTDDDYAIECYEKYSQMVTSVSSEAKSNMVDLYKHKNTAKALSLLSEDGDIMLKIKMAYVLSDEEKFQEALDICLPFVENFEDYQKRKKKKDDKVDDLCSRMMRDELSELILKTCKLLFATREYQRALEISKIAARSLHVFDEDTRVGFAKWYIGLEWHLKEIENAVNMIREFAEDLLIKDERSSYYWNLLSSVMWKAENIVLTQKFLVRLGSKFPDSIPLQVMIGHSSALRGTHKLALASYLQVYKHIKETIKKPNEIITVNDKEVWEYPPYFAKLLEMLCLCIGVAYIHLSINRRAADRQLLVLQGYTFMHEYYRLSGESEEASFNMGRAYHQLGLYQYAIFYYEKILRSSGDFVQEAAYNLAHIYKKSGNTALARQIIQENIVI